jgi:hypothetical protein
VELESLYLNRSYKNELRGTITFKGGSGKVELELQEAQIKVILTACANRMIEQAQEAANSLTDAVIEATKIAQLESKD